VAGQTTFLVVVLVVGVIGAGLAAAYLQAARAVTDRASAQVLAVAQSVAAEPDVVAGVEARDPDGVLQPLAEGVRRSTGTDFVVVMSTDGIRYSHPNPAEVGRRFVGHIAAAQAGGTVVEDYAGTLGPSRRAVVPVRDGGRVVGLVAVGIRKEAEGARLAAELPTLLVAAGVAGLLAAVGTTLIARRVRRQTRGLRAAELQAMHDHHDAVLHSVTEGLVLVDPRGRVRLANDEARRLLALGADPGGRALADLGLPEPLVEAMSDADPRDERAVAFATEELERAQHLTDRVVEGVEDPTLSALLLGKAAEAHERGIDLVLDPGLRWPAGVAPARDVVTVVGNLVDNALDAVTGAAGERRVEVSTTLRPQGLELVVADTGPGIPDELRERVLERGFSTKPSDAAGGRGLGLALVRHTVERLGGTVALGGPPGARVVVTLPLDGGTRHPDGESS